MGQTTNLLPLHLPSCSASRMLHDGVQRLREAHWKRRQMRGLDLFAPRQIRDRTHQPLIFNFFGEIFLAQSLQDRIHHFFQRLTRRVCLNVFLFRV